MACDFGVTRILYVVAVVVAVMFDDSEIAGVSLAGFEDDPYAVAPVLSVISTRPTPADAPVPNDTVIAVIVSVPIAVWNVKASAIVAAPPGASVTFDGSVPVASVVSGSVTGEPVGVTPVAE